MADAQETKQELIQAAKGLPPTEVFSLKPRTFDEAFRFANLIAESTLIPKEFQKSPANVLIAVQLGMELGVSPMQALQNMYVVNGRPAIFGDLLPAIVIGSGLLEEFVEEGDEKQASCTVKRKGLAPITRTFTMVDAERAGLPGRNPTYKAYPKRMLQMRARAYAFRDMFPDVLKGVAIKEDIEDTEPRDVTPSPEPIKTPQALAVAPKGDSKVEDPRQPLASTSATPQALPAQPKGKEAGATGAITNQRASGQALPTRTKGIDLASIPNQTQEAAGERSQEEIIAECLLWVENCSPEDLTADGNWLFEQLKGVKGTDNQLTVLRPFNDRRNSLLSGTKHE